MKKVFCLALLTLLSALFLTACGTNYETSESTVFIEKKGKIVSTDVESFDESKYSKADLEDYLDDLISTYNEEHSSKAVKKKSLKVKDGICTMVLSYASYEDYAAFNGYDIFTGSIAEALAAGYSFDGAFAAIKDETGTEADASDFTGESDYQVVIIKNLACNIHVYGDVSYVSVGNTAMVDDQTVSFAQGNLLAGVESQASTEGLETTEGSEVIEDTQADSASNGSVDEDEMVTGDEDEDEVVFSFDETEDSSSSLGSVYIIFK